MDLALEINSDKTVSGSLIYAISDGLAELGTTSDETDPTTDLFDTSAEGVTVTEYKENGYTGTKVILDRVPMSASTKKAANLVVFKSSEKKTELPLRAS